MCPKKCSIWPWHRASSALKSQRRHKHAILYTHMPNDGLFFHQFVKRSITMRCVWKTVVRVCSRHKRFAPPFFWQMLVARAIASAFLVSIERVSKPSERLVLSARPFCWGWYGAIVWCWIPCFTRNLLNCLLQYSPPLSLRMQRIRVLNCDSINALYFLTSPVPCSFA